MNVTWQIFKRELNAFFLSPVAYVVMAMFLIVTGILFYTNVMWYVRASFQSMQNPYMMQPLNLTDDFVRPLFANIAVLLLFIVPGITMRAFAEEKKSRTIELLLTYPVKDVHVILGKFFGSLAFFGILIGFTGFFPAWLLYIGDPEPGPMITAYAGYFLMGSAFIAIGIFFSSLTENQVIAALLAFGANLTFWIIGWVSPDDGSVLSSVLSYLSVIEHYDPLTQGILNTRNIVYFLSATVLFLFLTTRSLQSKQWRA